MLFLVPCVFCPLYFLSAYGDGLASETLPPVLVGNNQVILSISGSGASVNLPNAEKVVTFQLSDSENKPIQDVTYAVVASKGGKLLFGHTFEENDGKLTMTLVQYQTNHTSFQEESLSELENSTKIVNIVGPDLSAGLYRFKIQILTAYSYSNNLENPIKYDVQISIPEYDSYTIHDSTYGTQNLAIIGYYDIIKDFLYDDNKKSMNFTMLFNWSEDNINKVSVVHQEIRIPKSLANFIVTKYDAYVNGIKLADSSIAIDDYSTDDRIVHLILYKERVAELAALRQNPNQEMDFTLKPSNYTGFPLTVLSRTAQYKVNLSWDPPIIKPGSTTKFSFDVKDAYLITNKTIPVSYDFLILQNNTEVFSHSGITGQGNHTGDTVDVPIPFDLNGTIRIKLDNLGENKYATAEFLAVVVPEFPATSIVLLVMLAIIVLFSKLRLY